MAQVQASVKFDAAKGTATVVLELAGHTELEHELLVQFFASRTVSLVPFHVGDQLESRFVIEDADAFKNAQRATENRIRARDGRPTVEQEEAAKAAKAKAADEAQKANEEAVKLGYANAQDRAVSEAKDEERRKLAKAIVDEQESRKK